MKISCNDVDIQIATKAINDGAIVVFPTYTVYGLGCNPYNHDAVQSIYEIKKRKKTKPFPVIGYSKKELEKIVEFNSLEEKIADKFWPGPITLILKIKDKEIQKSLDLEGKIAIAPSLIALAAICISTSLHEIFKLFTFFNIQF